MSAGGGGGGGSDRGARRRRPEAAGEGDHDQRGGRSGERAAAPARGRPQVKTL